MTRKLMGVGIASEGVMFASRVAQIVWFTDNHMWEWWSLELLRWGLWIALVVILARALQNLQRVVAGQGLLLQTIVAEAALAKLELDAHDTEPVLLVS
jgi:hypothetical protein